MTLQGKRKSGIGERVGAPRAAGLAAAAAAAASTAASELKRGRGGAELSLSCRLSLPLTRGRRGALVRSGFLRGRWGLLLWDLGGDLGRASRLRRSPPEGEAFGPKKAREKPN
ncbi:uncharacterized protein LOC142876350 [Microcebus murinus]|uniref:uncharacterized protein LOC142876350 n=1 Tax=Microcebus murinus TaxID=30608 RepID=UPI003F6D6ED1